MKLIKEDITDYLKPKSEEEIQDALSEYSFEELVSIWYDTGDNNYLKYAVKKTIPSNPNETYKIDDSLLTDVLQICPEYTDRLINIIINKFPLQHKKENNEFYMLFDWADLYFLFNDTSNFDQSSAREILEGDSYNTFYTGAYDIELDDYEDFIEEVDQIISEEPLDDICSYVYKESYKLDLDNDKPTTLKDCLNLILNNKELKKSRFIFKESIANIVSIADESYAYQCVKKEILKYLNLDEKDIIVLDDSLKIKLNNEQIRKIFISYNRDYIGIDYYVPQYGFHGNIDDYKEDFIEELWNKTEEHPLNESFYQGSKIKIPIKFINKLLNYPEAGMGYQKVNVILKDGTILRNKTVLNGKYLKLDYENIDSQDIDNILPIRQ